MIRFGTKVFKTMEAAIKELKLTRPDVKDPKAYLENVQKIIEKRSKAKKK